MLRVSENTRARVQQVARDEFGGASDDEAIRRLLDEHWESRAVAAVEHYRADNPEGWRDYLADAADTAQADAAITDEWHSE